MKARNVISALLFIGLPLKALAVSGLNPRLQSYQQGQRAVIYNGPIVNVNPPSAGSGQAPVAAPQYPLPPEYPAPAPSYPQPTPTPTEIDPATDPHQRGLSLGGPRFGASYLQGGGLKKLRDAIHEAKPDAGEIDPVMTQFGWQIEYRMFRTSSGVTALTELIPLVGGMDQGLALPSATWLVGMRSRRGWELGFGPNVGIDGVSMMGGLGYTADLGGINVPLNVAVGRGASQTTSLSFSVGFNL